MGRYANLLSTALADAQQASVQIEVMVRRLSLPIRKPGWLNAVWYAWFNHLWLILTARFRLRHSQADVLHIVDGSYAYVVPEGGPAAVATVHDLIPWLRLKGRFGSDRGSQAAARLMARAFSGLRRCESLLADSDSTANDLTEYAGIEPSRMAVVPVALAPIFAAAAGITDRSRIAEQQGNYVLHVGNNSFYKNRAAVVRIFAQIDFLPDLRLIMAGEPPDKALLEQVQELSLQDRVDFIEEISDERLVQLYSDAQLLLFPSLYEGFGWPPLEAMACGCPVVCSSGGSLPEVAGPAALMAPAADESALAELCRSVLADPAQAERMSREGRAHARSFTMERMAQQTMSAYMGALGQQAAQDGD